MRHAYSNITVYLIMKLFSGHPKTHFRCLIQAQAKCARGSCALSIHGFCQALVVAARETQLD